MPGKRIHPLLLTGSEIIENPRGYVCDHLPVRLEIPLNSSTRYMLSWNLSTNAKGIDIRNRYFSLIESLCQFAQLDVQPIDIILLQEVNYPIFFEILDVRLRNSFDILHNNNMITLIRKNANIRYIKDNVKFIPKAFSNDHEYTFDVGSLQRFELTFNQSEVVVLHHVNSHSSINPYYIEHYYNRILRSTKANTAVIVAGETRSHIANISTELQPLTTSRIIERLQDGREIEISGFSTGGFICHLDKERTISQLKSQTMNYFNGIPYLHPKKSSASCKPATDRFHMVICLDKEIFRDKFDIDKFQDALISRFRHKDFNLLISHDHITARIAAKDNNQQGLAICFSDDTPELLIRAFTIFINKLNLNSENKIVLQIESDPVTRSTQTIFYLPRELIHAVNNAIENNEVELVIKDLQLVNFINAEINNRKAELEKTQNKKRFTSPDEKMACLEKLNTNLSDQNITIKPIRVIVYEWIKEATPILNKERYKLLQDRFFYKKAIRHDKTPSSSQIIPWLTTLLTPEGDLLRAYQKKFTTLFRENFEIVTNETGIMGLLILPHLTTPYNLLQRHGFSNTLENGALFLESHHISEMHDKLHPLFDALTLVSDHINKLSIPHRKSKRSAMEKLSIFRNLFVTLCEIHLDTDNTIPQVVSAWLKQGNDLSVLETPRSMFINADKHSDKTASAKLIRILLGELDYPSTEKHTVANNNSIELQLSSVF